MTQQVSVSGPATQTATIANGASLSAAVDLTQSRLARIGMPAAWTAAALTFQTSIDGSTYRNMYDEFGTEVTVQAAADRDIVLTLSMFLGVRFIKIRSGTAGTPVAQGAERALQLALA